LYYVTPSRPLALPLPVAHRISQGLRIRLRSRGCRPHRCGF